MGKRQALIHFCLLLALSAVIAKCAEAQQRAVGSEPQTIRKTERDASRKPATNPKNNSDLDSPPAKPPSLSEYQFTEALKKLQSGDHVPLSPPPLSQPPLLQRKSSVPPLMVVPLAPAGARSKDVPKDYVPKNDVGLNATGREAVSMSRQWQESEDIPAPGKDGRVVYVYGAGMPVVVCSPLRICVVELEAGEKLVGEPQIGDSVRWEISPATAGIGDSRTPLIVLKPTAAGLDTTMMIPTDRRAYYLRLESKPEEYLARVAFSYPQEETEQWKRFEQQQDAVQQKKVAEEKEKKSDQSGNRSFSDAVDAVYWDYAIKGGDRTMRPIRVLDDGAKTYIQMPAVTGRTEAPVLVIQGPDGGEMVNYRVNGDVYVVDRLFNRAALIVGAGKHLKKVEITRKAPIGDKKAAERHAQSQPDLPGGGS
jgi:P-type conjugative transfer protein TrbG